MSCNSASPTSHEAETITGLTWDQILELRNSAEALMFAADRLYFSTKETGTREYHRRAMDSAGARVRNALAEIAAAKPQSQP